LRQKDRGSIEKINVLTEAIEDVKQEDVEALF
jgi:hypothetical protein